LKHGATEATKKSGSYINNRHNQNGEWLLNSSLILLSCSVAECFKCFLGLLLFPQIAALYIKADHPISHGALRQALLQLRSNEIGIL
jgi:hypothetical protein